MLPDPDAEPLIPFWGESWRRWFQGRGAVLATMHQKEAVIAPVLQTTLAISVQVLPDFNTDAFGTFTRDVPRPGSQREAARRKAEAALARCDRTLAIASEGAFFPHPMMPWLACDRELILLLDREHHLEVVAEALSTDTNYAHCTASSVEAALSFATSVGFPEHGLVAMTAADDYTLLFKGIRTEAALINAIEQILAQQGTAHLETDMRAMHNPSRMRVIEQAAHQLVARLQQCCPECDCPGFERVERRPGLPCEWCQAPTPLVQQDIYQCQQCRHQAGVDFPAGIRAADPAQCGFCNP